jgi:hypothetical protein
MGTRTPEGGNPYNIDPNTLRLAPEQSRFHGVKKPEEAKQQPSDPELEAYRQLQREPRGSTIFVGPIRVPRPLPQNPGEQRGEAEPSQPNPEEQPEGARQRSADELFETIQQLPFEQLLELKPEEYGFRHIGDMLLYMLVEQRSAYFPGLYNVVSTRLEQEQHEAFEIVMGAPPSESNEELERTAFRLVDEKFLQVIQELASHWREQGKL